jgi:enamine deaminase RidA (YjgF/YER057c/UK114 family)
MRFNDGNSTELHPPLGAYSHTVAVPADSELVFISGQVGIDLDGQVPKTLPEQAELAFKNLIALLRANGAGVSDIIKLTIFLVKGQSLGDLRAVRSKYLGDHRPASTAIFIDALAAPEMLVEIEGVAVGRSS